MKKQIAKLLEWCDRCREQMRKRAVCRKQERLQEASQRVIQVREYGGSLWVCYNGAPTLRVKDLGVDLGEALERSRAAWVSYKLDKSVYEIIESYSHGTC